jgi:hypothetical protein
MGNESFSNIVNMYLMRFPSNAQDYMLNCGGQLNRLVIEFLKNTGINVANSVFTRNASSPIAMKTCKSANETYTYDTITNVLSWSSGNFDFGQIMGYVKNFLDRPIPSVGKLSSKVGSRLQECGRALPGKMPLVDGLFLYIRKTLTGQN